MSGCLSASLLARLLPLSWSVNDGSTEPLAAVAVCGRGLAVDSPVCLTVLAVSKCEPGCETGEKPLGRKLFYSAKPHAIRRRETLACIYTVSFFKG